MRQAAGFWMAALALILVVQPAGAQVGIGVGGGLTTPVGSLGSPSLSA